MRNDLYPNRKASYYIPTKGKNKLLRSEGPSQIHQMSKGGQITLAVLGKPYVVCQFHNSMNTFNLSD
jgi:hypothetical protein